jgi:hypothetical protein
MKSPKENGRDIGHAQGRAGVPALGLLHGIHGKKPDAVGPIPQVLVAGYRNCLDGRSGGGVSHDWRFLFRDQTGKEFSIGFAAIPIEVFCYLGVRDAKP